MDQIDWNGDEMAYLDNSATTKPLSGVVQAVLTGLTECWGNPSSLHRGGLLAERSLERSRQKVAASLGALPEEVFFTPSGTYATNAALFGALQANRRRGNHLITTAVEHSATHNAAKAWEGLGGKVTYLSPGIEGSGLLSQLEGALQQDTVLVSLMHVHNETGTVFPLFQAARLAHEKVPGVLVHADLVQSFLKVPFSLKKEQVDFASVSAHKIHGPKGIGALYKKRGVRLLPVTFGGGQEGGLFPGTENVALAAGFGTAAETLFSETPSAFQTAKEQNRYIRDRLLPLKEGKIISPKEGLPYILSLSLPGYQSEAVLHFLEEKGVYVSSGSACAKGALSRSLLAFQLSRPEAAGFLRISLSRFTKKEELERAVEALFLAVATIRKK